ncbi:MAG: 3-isopropylmalate dehydratase large subunit [Mycoplasmatales bacterium]
MATLFNKLWDKHVVYSKDNRDLLYIDRHYVHEVTSPQAFSGLRLTNRLVKRPDLTFATMDHNIPTTRAERQAFTDPQAKIQVETLVKNCQQYGIEVAEMDSEKNGIVHVIGPETGRSFPGQTIVCGDSHTATHGAFANIAFGIGTSEVEHVLATQTLWQTRPQTLGIKLVNKLAIGVTSKDVILQLIAEHGVSFGTGFAFEFYGEGVLAMTMEERMTMCNMAIEAGAKYGLVAYDQTTFEYMKNTAIGQILIENPATIDYWQTLVTDSETDFDQIVVLDLATVEPFITWGINPSQGVKITENVPEIRDQEDEAAFAYTNLKPGQKAMDIPVDFVFIGSCTNGRLSDLKLGTKYIKGRKVAASVKAIVVPGSEKVRQQAEALGIDKLYTDAGFEWRLPGCSACLGMNTDQVPAGKHSISTSNRNFVGRQGNKAITHLASVPTAVVAALSGRLVDVRKEN